MEYLTQHIESLIFTAEQPINTEEIRDCLEETFDTQLKEEELEDALNGLIDKYKADEFSFEIIAIGGGFQFLTKGAYHQSIGTLLRQNTKKRLSKAALETLSIVAYKQPVTKVELEKIRGVSCDYAIQKLLEKELVTIIGRSDSVGRPLLYSTSEKFMDYFGISNLDDLPKPKDFKAPDSEIGEAAPIEEAVDENGEAIIHRKGGQAPGDLVMTPSTYNFNSHLSESVKNITTITAFLDGQELEEEMLSILLEEE